MTEEINAGFDAIGQPIQRNIVGVLCKCECGAMLTTIVDQTHKESGITRTYWEPKAYEVFMAGGMVTMECKKCGKKLNVRKSLLEHPGTAGAPKVARQKVEVVKG